MRKFIVAVCFLIFCSCSKDDKLPNIAKTNILINYSDELGKGSVSVQLNNNYIPFEVGRKSIKLSLIEDDSLKITGIARESDLSISGYIGATSIIKETIIAGDTLVFNKIITRYYLDSLGAWYQTE